MPTSTWHHSHRLYCSEADCDRDHVFYDPDLNRTYEGPPAVRVTGRGGSKRLALVYRCPARNEDNVIGPLSRRQRRTVCPHDMNIIASGAAVR